MLPEHNSPSQCLLLSKRDYSLTGTSTKSALATGLAAAQWYHTDVPREKMKALMRRSDFPAIKDTLLYYGLMVLFAVIGVALWPISVWSAPFWFAYATLYASIGADSRWHECGHGTAFKSRWMNNVVYQIAQRFCLLRNPAVWRWSHARHHTDTIIVGRDPEIITMRPPKILKIIPLFFGWDTVIQFFKTIRYAFRGCQRRRSELYTGASAWGSETNRTNLVADISCDFDRGIDHKIHSAVYDSFRPGGARFMALYNDRFASTHRACRQCCRSQTQYQNSLYESDQPVYLLEHELPYRTPYVSDGALPCFA